MGKLKLGYDYNISVDNMLDITESIGNFVIFGSEFYSMKKGKIVNKKILVDNNMQIFKMDDGIYILEKENTLKNTIKYYYSTDINDLI